MIFTETSLPGAYIIDLELRPDSRGFFARAFCQKVSYDRKVSAIVRHFFE